MMNKYPPYYYHIISENLQKLQTIPVWRIVLRERCLANIKHAMDAIYRFEDEESAKRIQSLIPIIKGAKILKPSPLRRKIIFKP